MGPLKQRCITRHPQGSLVTIHDDRTGYQYPASIHTCARGGGVYLESNYAPRPGSALHIHFNIADPGAGKDACGAVVRWRRSLLRSDSSWSYGLGIQYA